jgi:thioredoxin-related protein
MKTKIFLFLISLFVVSVILYCIPGQELKWQSFNSAMEKNKSSKKKIVIDVYTNWCGWCKKMDYSTYRDSEVIKYLEEKYIAVKLNAESDSKLMYEGVKYSEQEFSGKLGITGYPATVFFNENCKLITIVPGYLQPKQFLIIAKYIAEDAYKTQSFDDYIKKQKVNLD